MSLCKAIIKKAVPLPQIESFQRYLFIGAHPDDIEVGAGATAAKLSAEGKDVAFLICTDGRFGYENISQDTSAEELIEIRKEESISAAASIGISNVYFLGLSDGGFYSNEDLYRGIIKTITEFQPDMLFCPDPCVTSECHVDHLNVGNAVRRIAYLAHHTAIMEQYGYRGANVKAIGYFMTADFNCYVKTSGYVDKQLHALFDFHLSQFPKGCSDAKDIRTYILLRSKCNGLKRLCGDAEGFRVLGLTHMHCLPEAGD